jgi:hypothetical protein
MPPIPTALDALLEHYGVSAVAEVTGRSKRLVRDGTGQQRLESRSPRTNLAETTAFMTGAKRILVFSDAGGTGRSYHASLDAKNQQRRVHFLLEPGWRADRAIQGLGRTHRTHQACPPLFRPVTTDCKGEARFTSTIARRLDALGALTRGQRQTGGQGMFDASDNLESSLCQARAARLVWAARHRQAQEHDACPSSRRMSGLELTDQDGMLREDLPPIQRWLNRILAMKIAVQNAIFDEFLTLVETRVSAAKEAGTFDIGVETVSVETCEVLSDTVIRTDPVTGATSHLLELSLTQRRKVLSLERVLKMASYEDKPLFLRNDKSGKVALASAAPSHMDEEGHIPSAATSSCGHCAASTCGPTGLMSPRGNRSPRPRSARCGRRNTPPTKASSSPRPCILATGCFCRSGARFPRRTSRSTASSTSPALPGSAAMSTISMSMRPSRSSGLPARPRPIPPRSPPPSLAGARGRRRIPSISRSARRA